MPPILQFEILVPAPISQVWQAWTTAEGCQTFFAPKAHVELRPFGPYEQLFELSRPKGEQGSEGCVILAFEPLSMLSFTWNAPPSMPELCKQRTHITLYFESEDKNHTHLLLQHGGWGRGESWQEAFNYFERAWKNVVLPRLVYRFTHGPVDWNRPEAFQKV